MLSLVVLLVDVKIDIQKVIITLYLCIYFIYFFKVSSSFSN